MGYYLYLPPVQPLSGGGGQENYELHQTSVLISMTADSGTFIVFPLWNLTFTIINFRISAMGMN